MSLEVYKWNVCLLDVAVDPSNSSDICAFPGRSGMDGQDNTLVICVESYTEIQEDPE